MKTHLIRLVEVVKEDAPDSPADAAMLDAKVIVAPLLKPDNGEGPLKNDVTFSAATILTWRSRSCCAGRTSS